MGFLRQHNDERGMSLAEVLVAMVITAIITMAVTAGAIAVYRGRNYTTQDSDSLSSLRIAMDRFEREVRQARRIYSDSTDKIVHLWVDYDRDNQQDLNEKIYWTIDDLGSGRADFLRSTDAAPGSPVIQVRNIVFDEAETNFSYNAVDPINATVIEILLVARGQGNLAGKREVRTEVRLRNATAP